MTSHLLKNRLMPATAAVAILLFPLTSVLAKPGGLYKGRSSGNTLNPAGPPATFYGGTPIKLRFPNGKGKLSGVIQLTKAGYPGPAPANVKISGRVTRVTVRQGGKKHIIRGTWTWNFKSIGQSSKAKGPFSINLKQVGSKYRFAPPISVVVKGKAAGGNPSYRFQSAVTAEK